MRIRESAEGGGKTYALVVEKNKHLNFDASTIEGGPEGLFDDDEIGRELVARKDRYRKDKPSGAWSDGRSGGFVGPLPDDLVFVLECPGEAPFSVVFGILRACKRAGLESISLSSPPEKPK